MSNDGTPELAAKRCGEVVAQLRTLRRWSRVQLVMRLYDEIAFDDPNYDSISEAWLARLENGRMVKVPRQTVEALCRALHCTPQERARVLLYADRNVLNNMAAEPTPVAELLTYVMDRLYAESHEMLASLLEQRGVEALDELELFEMTATALELVIAHRRKRQERQRQADRPCAPVPQRAVRG